MARVLAGALCAESDSSPRQGRQAVAHAAPLSCGPAYGRMVRRSPRAQRGEGVFAQCDASRQQRPICAGATQIGLCCPDTSHSGPEDRRAGGQNSARRFFKLVE